MAKVQAATAEEVEAFLYDNLPEAVAGPVAGLVNNLMTNHSSEVDTGDEPEQTRRPAGRRAPPVDDDQEEVQPKPKPKPARGRTAATDDQEDEEGLLGEGDLVPEQEDDDDTTPAAKPARGGRRAAPVDDDEDAAPEPKPRRGAPKTVAATFKALGLDAATIKGYAKEYADTYTSKQIKTEIAENHRTTLKGTDVPTLAKQAANIYEADTQLQTWELADLETQAETFGIEPDLTGKRGEKAKKLAIIDEIISACLENL